MTVDIYVDGSYNEQRRTYGSGVVIILPDGGAPLSLKLAGNTTAYLAHRNITGELRAVVLALDTLYSLEDIDEVNLFYDYAGIEKWVTGEWQAKKPISQGYVEAMKKFTSRFKINFSKVRAHSGDKYNSLADKLAREATFLEPEELTGGF